MLYQKENLVWYAKYFIYILFLNPFVVFSQGVDNLWLTGYDCGSGSICGVTATNFSSGYPDTSHVNISMNFLDCNANISDSLGNLLFYTNGIYIANSNNDTMVNGSGLSPSSYTTQHINVGLRVKQGNLILPMPGNSNLFYLFHETLTWYSLLGDYRVSELYYSIIDMSLDSGRGVVTQKNNVLLSDTLTIGSISACKHANGRDWWIMVHKAQGRRYYEYLLTLTGLQGPFIQDIGYSILPRDWSWQTCFSPDGSKFANVFTKDTFDILAFDRCTGLFSNCSSICIDDSANARGVAFAPNSELFYISSSKYVYQFSAISTFIDSSKINLGTFDKFAEPIPPFYTAFYLAQLAVNGKIYINTGNSTRYFNVINNPNIIGLGCNFIQHSFILSTYNGLTIPNFPNYFLGKETGSICDSLPLIIGPSNSEQERHSSERLPVRIISDRRGEAVCPIEDNYDEKKTYEYFLRMSSDSLIKPK